MISFRNSSSELGTSPEKRFPGKTENILDLESKDIHGF